MKLIIGNDHAGTELKFEIKEYLEGKGYEVINYGTDTSESVHYPQIGAGLAEKVAAGEADLGILICGTGVGISLAANKVPGIRAAVCSDVTTAHLVREHNHANIIAFGARIVGSELAKDIVDAFLNAKPLGGRHQERVEMITDVEKKYCK
ncbi:MAG: ribose 5-phosphate isomerase B [Lachnospiraceae bacterium]|nr:ribose 5-phosphate isomerase B [Lachnospiraceae bacterium]MBQ2576217.1 ribose 5-phosphate isomerase B [Lachnospiraceae bacterium]MCR4731642.1 ribose 5-phosphate isomerase B [Lachnospiraceae bacterium]MEE3355991.1 ribose 5-phosphate isomerase B [Candidatus Weimeria sp.]